MSILFHPEPRMLLMCDFDSGFRPPEMVKVRPVVVLSPRRHNRETCIVVPVSTAEPTPIEAFHHKLDPESLPSRLRGNANWVKGNMITTVAHWRLDRVRVGRDRDGTRLYATPKVTDADWVAVCEAVSVALGLGGKPP